MTNPIKWDKDDCDPLQDIADIKQRLMDSPTGLDLEAMDKELKWRFIRLIGNLPPPATLGLLRDVIDGAIKLWGKDTPVYRMIKDGTQEEGWLFMTVRRAVDELPDRFVIGGG